MIKLSTEIQQTEEMKELESVIREIMVLCVMLIEMFEPVVGKPIRVFGELVNVHVSVFEQVCTYMGVVNTVGF